MKFINFFRLAIFLLCSVAWHTSTLAQGFAALVSPPRFEMVVKAGERSREVFEITHASNQPATYRVYTADWTFTPEATVNFQEALKPDSCRPWVALERRELPMKAQQRLRFRFEIEPPANAPAGECRFAIMIEGAGQTMQSDGLSIPVNGRLGVIVYARLGEAVPKLEVVETKTVTDASGAVPALIMRNSGNAHGRLAGFLSGRDAAGQAIEFTPTTYPILPGETRIITLQPSLPGGKAATLQYPVTVKGTLEWENQRMPLEQTFNKSEQTPAPKP